MTPTAQRDTYPAAVGRAPRRSAVRMSEDDVTLRSPSALCAHRQDFETPARCSQSPDPRRTDTDLIDVLPVGRVGVDQLPELLAVHSRRCSCSSCPTVGYGESHEPLPDAGMQLCGVRGPSCTITPPSCTALTCCFPSRSTCLGATGRRATDRRVGGGSGRSGRWTPRMGLGREQPSGEGVALRPGAVQPSPAR